MSRWLALVALISSAAFLLWDSWFHFDSDLVWLKRKHQSAQRHWNVHYSQNYVYYDSHLRYVDDFRRLKTLIEPGYLVFADKASSYYASAMLPLYSRNVQRHQGREGNQEWRNFLRKRMGCRLNREENIRAFHELVLNGAEQEQRAQMLRYVLMNIDDKNKNLRLDCHWQGKSATKTLLETYSQPMFRGDYIEVYDLFDAMDKISDRADAALLK